MTTDSIVDSVIEVLSSVAARLRRGADPGERERAEYITRRIIGLCSVGLATYILAEASHSVATHEVSDRTVAGVVIAALVGE